MYTRLFSAGRSGIDIPHSSRGNLTQGNPPCARTEITQQPTLLAHTLLSPIPPLENKQGLLVRSSYRPDSFYVEQPNEWNCGPAVMVMACRAVLKSNLSIAEAAALLHTSEATGTDNAALAQALLQRGSSKDVRVYQSGTFNLLARLLKAGFLVIVNFRSLEENEGHFGIVNELSTTHIQIADPELGPKISIPLKNFTWRGGFADSGCYGWCLAAR